jgi:hypothetical protein
VLFAVTGFELAEGLGGFNIYAAGHRHFRDLFDMDHIEICLSTNLYGAKAHLY